MAGETSITAVGNVVNEPELRFTPAGDPVCTFRLACTPRKYNSTTQKWEDGETLFWTVSVWKDQAEHVSNSLTMGQRVIVVGSLKAREWQTKEGERRTSVDIVAEEVGPSLKFADAQVRKAVRSDREQSRQERNADPWATS